MKPTFMDKFQALQILLAAVLATIGTEVTVTSDAEMTAISGNYEIITWEDEGGLTHVKLLDHTKEIKQ